MEQTETPENLRKMMDSLRRELSPEAAASLSAKACAKLLQRPEYAECTDVFLYKAVGGEADPSWIAADALSKGKRTAYPVSQKGGIMDFYYAEKPEDFVKGMYGIPEPDTKKCELAVPGEGRKVLLVVPGVAFGKDGRRIGHGAGYYDRYIARYENEIFARIGFCYAFQITPLCPPPKPTDKSVLLLY